jgi:hypothetical protein
MKFFILSQEAIIPCSALFCTIDFKTKTTMDLEGKSFKLLWVKKRVVPLIRMLIDNVLGHKTMCVYDYTMTIRDPIAVESLALIKKSSSLFLQTLTQHVFVNPAHSFLLFFTWPSITRKSTSCRLPPYFSSSAHRLPYFFKPLVFLLISSNPKSYPKLHPSCGTYIMHALSPTISGPVRISCFDCFSGLGGRIVSKPLIPAPMCVAYIGILGAYSHSTSLAYYPKCSTLPTENAH